MTQEAKFYALGGGLDVVTPAIAKTPGRVIASGNYEPNLKGYRRIDGFERFDGNLKPSKSSYSIVTFSTGISEPAINDFVIGLTSGAEGFILDIVIESGSFVGGDAVGYFAISEETGNFVNGEQITISKPIAFSSGFSNGFY